MYSCSAVAAVVRLRLVLVGVELVTGFFVMMAVNNSKGPVRKASVALRCIFCPVPLSS